MSDWVQVSCNVSDLLMSHDDTILTSSGSRGDRYWFTEWAVGGVPLLRTYFSDDGCLHMAAGGDGNV